MDGSLYSVNVRNKPPPHFCIFVPLFSKMLLKHPLLVLMTTKEHPGMEHSIQDRHQHSHIDPQWFHKEDCVKTRISCQRGSKNIPKSLIPKNQVDRGAIDNDACITRVEKEFIRAVFDKPVTRSNGQLVL